MFPAIVRRYDEADDTAEKRALRAARAAPPDCLASRSVIASTLSTRGDSLAAASAFKSQQRAAARGKWGGGSVRRPFHLALFLTAPRVVLPQDPGTSPRLWQFKSARPY